MNVLLLRQRLGMASRKAAPRAARKKERSYSAATTTTATTRDAAQVDCAALGEHRLKAG
jgi:hypothetical protein